MTENNKPEKSIIPLLLTIVISCFILFLIWSARQAATGGTDVTDRDYYSKGLKYNSTLVEKRAASVIGWKLETHLDDRLLILALTDKNNNPITGAIGQLIFNNKNFGSLPLSEQKPGHYSIELPQNYSGELPVRVDFEKQGARITRQLLLNIGN